MTDLPDTSQRGIDEGDNCHQHITNVSVEPLIFQIHCVKIRALCDELESICNTSSFPRTRESRLSTSEIVESLDSRVRGNDGTFEFI
jgi:hypothetical protein